MTLAFGVDVSRSSTLWKRAVVGSAILMPLVITGINVSAWRAYQELRVEGQRNPSMDPFMDPSTWLGRPYDPAIPPSAEDLGGIVRFWKGQDDPVELWVDVLDPFSRTIVYDCDLGRNCLGLRPALRLEWTLQGWRIGNLGCIAVRGWADPQMADGRPHLWIRMWGT